MKNYFVIISIMIIFLVPLNASAGIDEPLLEDISAKNVSTSNEKQPYVSSYLMLRNSNGELVGGIHFNTVLSKNHIIFGDNFDIPISENITIKESQYQMSVPIQTENFIDADCNNAAQESLGYGNIYGTCFFYAFRTSYIPIMTNQETGETLALTVWDSLHHGYVAEAGDTVTINWTILIPRN